jgi:hypothetical protein
MSIGSRTARMATLIAVVLFVGCSEERDDCCHGDVCGYPPDDDGTCRDPVGPPAGDAGVGAGGSGGTGGQGGAGGQTGSGGSGGG